MNEHKINTICDERYREIKKTVENHEERLTDVEKLSAKYFEKVDNVVASVDGLTSTLKWGIGVLVTIFIAIIGFIISITLK